jgi:hypothetical protein
MGQEYIPDTEVASWLESLGVASLCEWNLLSFLYRHQTSLVGAGDLAGLLGYTTESVVAAMDALASLGLIGRSRVSHGARFYQFTVPPDSPRGEAFAGLLALASHPAGRLRLSKQFRRNGPTPAPGLQAARPIGAESRPAARVIRLRSQDYESPAYAGRYTGRKIAWRKAV